MKKTNVLSVEKMSKKARKAYFNGQRTTWGDYIIGFNPVTRTVPNKKAYDRSRAKAQLRAMA